MMEWIISTVRLILIVIVATFFARVAQATSTPLAQAYIAVAIGVAIGLDRTVWNYKRK